MNTDFRLSVGYFEHPKVQKLERRLGAEGVLSHLRLLRFVSQYKPDGNLSGMDAEEVGMAGGFKGEAGTFVDALISLRLLDKRATGLHVHDWADHNPYAAHAEARTEKARKAADVRWGNARPQYQECSEHDLALPQASLSNAPSPTPNPTPVPAPNPAPNPDPIPSPKRPITIDPCAIASGQAVKSDTRNGTRNEAQNGTHLAEADLPKPCTLIESLDRMRADEWSRDAPPPKKADKPLIGLGDAVGQVFSGLNDRARKTAGATA